MFLGLGFAFLEYYKEKKRYYNLSVVCPKPLLCFGSQDYKPTPRAGFIYVVFTGLLCIAYLYMKINTWGFSTVFGDSPNPAWRVMWVDSIFVFKVAVLGLNTFLGSFSETSSLWRNKYFRIVWAVFWLYSPLVVLWDDWIYFLKVPFQT